MGTRACRPHDPDAQTSNAGPQPPRSSRATAFSTEPRAGAWHVLATIKLKLDRLVCTRFINRERLPICRETEGRGGKHDFQTWRTPDLMMEPCPSPHGLTNSTLQSNNDPEIPQMLRVAHTPKQGSRHKLAPTASPCRDFSRGSIERIFANPDISKSAN